ncbi:MAG: M23 family metallopeptidase [Bacteroidota bacterium]
MRRNHILFFILLLFNAFHIKAQFPYPGDYFRSPVDFPISLSGTFAELRGNHFHSGIDITTQKEEGKNIYACADGYISRIKISPYGFGKALYITHPNGYTTVYAHLSSFNNTIDQWLRAEQYKLELFEVDLFPKKNELHVNKGEIVCYSGNSGSSEGPHLHFEIRDSESEKPIDPQLFGFEIRDFIRPAILSLRIYPEGGESSIANMVTEYTPELSGWGPVYRLKNKDTVNVAGSFSLGLLCHDLLNGNKNRNGISSYSVYIDSILKFNWQAETFSFSETRYINSFIDFAHFYKSGQRYIRTKIDPNNKLSMYRNADNRGVFTTIPGSILHVRITVSDASKNESILRFIIRGVEGEKPEQTGVTGKPVISCLKSNTFEYHGITMVFPENSLYDDLFFDFSFEDAGSNTCSPYYNIHHPEVPLHDYINLTILMDSIFHVYGSKMTLASIKPGKAPYSIGGEFKNGLFKAKIREFGQYTVMLDTLPPVIKPLNISEGKIITTQQTIRLSIRDDFSGIKSYRATLNGKWILMDYDAKNRLLEYKRDNRLFDGKNEFLLRVEDYCGNASKFEAILIN